MAAEMSLSDYFNKAFDKVDALENCPEPSNSDIYQNIVKTGIEILTSVEAKVQSLNLFSSNEDFEEVHTNEIKYFLVSAFLAELQSKYSVDRTKRKENITQTENYVISYLTLCKNYGLGPLTIMNNALVKHSSNISTQSSNSTHDTKYLNEQRNAKIEKYKREMEIKKKLASMKEAVKNANTDDEVVREFWLTLIEKWIYSLIDLLQNLKQEKEMIAYMENMNPSTEPANRIEPQKKPMKTIILTRDAVQAKVFGAGYPSLPTMTVEEYADLEMKSMQKRMEKQSLNEQNKECKSDEDDSDEKVYKQRQFDDWKDTHRRGEGNRKNMG